MFASTESTEMLPTVSFDETLNTLTKPRPFAVSNAQIYRFRNHQKVFKLHGTEHEIEMMLAAGDCSIRPLQIVIGSALPFGRPPIVYGYSMSLEKPLEVIAVDPAQRLPIVHGTIAFILELHRKGVVHGDVRPANMLICSDGRLRLCDFAEGRLLNGDTANWEGDVTPPYMPPNRCRACDWPNSGVLSPTVEDDLYGLSIWELYTGKVPWGGSHLNDDVVAPMLKAGKTVNVEEVEDEEIREVIRGYLRCGGAIF